MFTAEVRIDHIQNLQQKRLQCATILDCNASKGAISNLPLVLEGEVFNFFDGGGEPPTVVGSIAWEAAGMCALAYPDTRPHMGMQPPGEHDVRVRTAHVPGTA